MKLYRADYQTEDGCFMVWAPSKAEAAHLQRERVKQAGENAVPGAVRPVDIPRTRPALVAWLNRNYNADNG